MTRASASDLLRRRLRAQSLTAGGAQSVADVARRLLATQAQDLPAARWALGVRSPGSTDADVGEALETGTVVRHWPLRGTLQLVARDDLRWLLELSAERQWAASARVRRDWSIDDAVLETARAASIGALEGARQLTRAELSAAITAAGVDMSGGRGYQVIYALAITGTLVWGRPDGGSQRLALLDELVADVAPLDPGEALARLAARYLAGHGAATAADLAWWAGITLTQARQGLQAAGARTAELGDETYYLDDADDAAPPQRRLLLLPAFDEYLLGYRHRDLLLDPAHLARVAPSSNGRFLPIIVESGRVTGTWLTTRTGVEAQPFDPASAPAPAPLAAAARAYEAFAARH